MKKMARKFLHTPPIAYYRYLKIRVQRVKARKIITDYLKRNTVPKLTIGCGNNIVKGWLNTDINPLKTDREPVVYLDAGMKFPFEDNCFQYIYSEHIFEHLTFTQSCNMLSECYRILRPDGVMRLALPHADFLFDLYRSPETVLHKGYIDFTMEYFCQDIYEVLGENDLQNVYVVNNFYRDWGHQVLHTFKSLSHLVEKFGFSGIQRKNSGESDNVVFKNLEREGRLAYPKEFYDLETLVIEAKKLN